MKLTEDLISMNNQQETRMKTDLKSEIDALEGRYRTIVNYLGGMDMEILEITMALRAFKEDLSAISAHILTLYVMKGQRVKITWDSLLNNIDTALDTLNNSFHPNPRAAIRAALSMSEPRIEEVMNYIVTLKTSL
jgi:hypothetical protein